MTTHGPAKIPAALFFGSPEFAVPSLDAMASLPGIALLGVVTQPDKPAGRGHVMEETAVATRARALGLRCWKAETKAAITSLVSELQPDICIVVAYGRIIPADAIQLPRLGFINVHPSLLPRWRGPSPIAAAIAAGDTETGVTIMRIDHLVDHGPILGQERVTIPRDATRGVLEQDLAIRGAALLARELSQYVQGHGTLAMQNDVDATTCPLLTRDDGRIDWTQTASVIERRVRAYEGWPGTWALLPDGRRIKVLSTRIEHAKAHNLPHGSIIPSPTALWVACGDGTVLELCTVQPEGKQSMEGIALLRGSRTLDRLA